MQTTAQRATLWIATLLCTLGTANSAGTSDYQPASLVDSGKVCVERYEDLGLGNVSPVTIVIRNQIRLEMLGGQAACFFLSAVGSGAKGISYSLQMQWADPYEAREAQQSGSKVRRQRSQDFGFELSKNALVEFEVCTRADATHDAGQWLLRRKGNRSQGRCTTDR